MFWGLEQSKFERVKRLLLQLRRRSFKSRDFQLQGQTMSTRPLQIRMKQLLIIVPTFTTEDKIHFDGYAGREGLIF